MGGCGEEVGLARHGLLVLVFVSPCPLQHLAVCHPPEGQRLHGGDGWKKAAVVDYTFHCQLPEFLSPPLSAPSLSRLCPFLGCTF